MSYEAFLDALLDTDLTPTGYEDVHVCELSKFATPGDHIAVKMHGKKIWHEGIYVDKKYVIDNMPNGIDQRKLAEFAPTGHERLVIIRYDQTTADDLEVSYQRAVAMCKFAKAHPEAFLAKYDALLNNCEHFATMCRTGRRTSNQVKIIADAIFKILEGHRDTALWCTAEGPDNCNALSTDSGSECSKQDVPASDTEGPDNCNALSTDKETQNDETDSAIPSEPARVLQNAVNDVPMLISMFVDEHRDELHKAVVRADNLFLKISSYVLAAAPGAKLRSQQMQSVLTSAWGAKFRPHMFVDAGIMPAVHFPGLVYSGLVQQDRINVDPEKRFLTAFLQRTGDPGDRVTLKNLFEAFKVFCSNEDVRPPKKKLFKPAAIAVLGPITLASNGMANFWKGWRLRDGESARVDVVGRVDL